MIALTAASDGGVVYIGPRLVESITAGKEDVGTQITFVGRVPPGAMTVKENVAEVRALIEKALHNSNFVGG